LEGFLRRYAGYLGLEEAPLVQQLHHHFHEAERPGISGPAPRQDPERSVLPPAAARSLWLLVGGGAAALALSLTYIKLEERSAAAERSLTVRPVASPVAPAPVPAPAPAVSHEARVWARSAAWSRVWVDGRVRFEGILAAGSRKTWIVQKSLRVAGNPSLVEVRVDGAVLSPKAGGSEAELVWSRDDAAAVPHSSAVGGLSEPPAAAPEKER
jgi:cytoskeletal protein RodZ